MNQSQFLAITYTLLESAGKIMHTWVRLVLVLPLTGRKTGASFLSQSLSMAIAITKSISTVI